MNLASRSPKRKAVDSPRVTFKEDDSDNKPPPCRRATKKFKVGKPFKTGMKFDESWDKATQKAFTDGRNEFVKKNPKSMEAKKRKRNARKRELYAEFQKKSKELDR